MTPETEQEAWLQALRRACDASSQATVADRLQREGSSNGYPSTALINQVLKGTYRGNNARIKSLVEGVLMSDTVECPALGHEIPRERCTENHSRKDLPLTGPHRVMLKRTCPTCKHNTCKRTAA